MSGSGVAPIPPSSSGARLPNAHWNMATTRIALLQRQQRQGRIVILGGRVASGAGVEGRVLHGVGELVGVGDLRLGGQAGIGHHHHSLVLEVVEAQHLSGVQLLGQLPDVLVRGQQSHGAEREVVGGQLLVGPGLVEERLQLDRQLGRG